MIEEPVLLDAAYDADPFPVYRRLRESFPKFSHPQLGFVLSRHAQVAAAANHPLLSTECYGPALEPLHGGPTLMQMHGPEHTWRRRLLSRGLTGQILKARYVAIVDDVCRQLLDTIEPGVSFDFVEKVTKQLPIAVIVRVLGLPTADVPLFHRWYSALVASFANFAGDPAIHRAGEEARDALGAYLIPEIERRFSEPQDDLLSAFCVKDSAESHALSVRDIRAFASLMLLAGGETTDKAIANLFTNLLENPSQLSQLRAEPLREASAICESLRHSPPVHMNMRTVTASVELDGIEFPEGSSVTLLLASANRDERKFTAPDVFDMNRTDSNPSAAFSAASDHVSFGRGAHFCIGAPLAHIEIQTVLRHMLKRFKHWQLTQDVVHSGTFTRGPKSVLMQVQA